VRRITRGFLILVALGCSSSRSARHTADGDSTAIARDSAMAANDTVYQGQRIGVAQSRIEREQPRT